MVKQPKQKALSEHDRLREENRRLKIENDQLKSDLEDAHLGMMFFKHGTKGSFDEIKQERRQYEKTITDLQDRIIKLQRDVPFEVMDPNWIPADAPIRVKRENGRWQRSVVGVTLVARDDDGQHYEFFKAGGIFQGDREMAVIELGTKLAEMVLGVPELNMLPKLPKALESIQAELLQAVTILSGAEDKESYNKARKEHFDKVIWPKMDKDEDNVLPRAEAMDRFYKFVETTFKNWDTQRRLYWHNSQYFIPEVVKHKFNMESE